MEGVNEAKQVDKRKAPETSDSSQNSSQAPMKKPRIELHRMESSDVSMNSIKEGNGSVAKRSIVNSTSKDSDGQDMPSYYEEKVKQIILSATGKDSVDNSSNDNFFTEIKKREEMHRLNDNSSVDDDNHETEEVEKPAAPRRRGRPPKRASEIESQEEVPLNGPLTVTMAIYDEKNQRFVKERLSFQSDTDRVQAFLQQHGLNLSGLHVSGYSADISSQENSENVVGRASWNSLGSTIPRESIVSIASSSAANQMKPPAVSGRGRKRQPNDREPIAASTKIGDLTENATSTSNNVDMHLSNGDDHTPNGDSPKETSEGKMGRMTKQTPTHSNSNTPNSDEIPVKRGRGRPPKSAKKDGAPGPSKSPSLVGSRNSQADSSMDFSSDKSMEEKAPTPRSTAAPRGRPSKAKTKLSLSAAGSQSTSGGKLTVTRESNAPGTSTSAAKSVTFEVDLLSDEELVSLVTSTTLWGTIGVGEPVFARWRDKSYYSGVVTAKGHNDTWHISFEDEMDDVASETHIVPVRIIGIGVYGVYSPDGVYAPHRAEVVGQKFTDADGDEDDIVQKAFSVMYAIRCEEFERPIWCTRRQLSIGENDAKELRKEFSPSAIVAKAADINLDNVVEGRRARGSVAAAPKVVGGAFDASADEVMLNSSSLTPLRRYGTPSQKPIKEESAESSPTNSRMSGRLPSTSTSTSTPTTSQEAAASDVSEKPAPKRPGRPRKQMFDGMQFFLTASGGGDPSQDDAVIIPYDKAELKDSIEKNGGKVVDAVSKEKGTANIFLISDSHARTVKYIYCLAGGIPCVSYEWIRKCAEGNQLLDWVPFRLKSGYSLEQEEVIERHTQKPLKGMKIYVTAESDELYNYWKPVLTAAQAILLRPNKKTLAIPPEAEVLVTDATCATNLLNTANKNLIPIVKPEWLVQTIITGTKADFFGHERYRVPNGELENADEENDPPE